jgi:hypothetical protein
VNGDSDRRLEGEDRPLMLGWLGYQQGSCFWRLICRSP